MSNAILGYKNVFDTASLFAPAVTGSAFDSWSSSLANLQDPRVGKQARSSNMNYSSTVFGFRLANVTVVPFIALVNHSLSYDALVRCRVGYSTFDVDFMTDQETEWHFSGSPGNFSGGVNGTRVAATGIIVAATTPRLDYDASSLANGFAPNNQYISGANWLTTAAYCPWGNSLAGRKRAVVFAGVASYLYQTNNTFYTGDYTVSGKVRCINGNGDFCFFTNDGAEHAGALLPATSEWKDFTQTLTGTSFTITGQAGVKKLTSGGTLEFRNMQLERGSVKTETRNLYGFSKLFRCKGLLNEPARTNLCLQSAAFNTTWTTNLLTVTANTATGPDGTTSADLLTNTATAGDSYVNQTVTNAGVAAYSVYVKKGTSARAMLRLLTAATVSTDDFIFFDFSTLTFSGSTGAVTKLGYVPMNDGWFRIWAVKAAQAGQTSSTMRLKPGNSSNTSTNGETLLVWGAQIEAAESISSYIPTTTVSVTRTADVGFTTPANPSYSTGDWNQTEGTFYVEAEVPASSALQSITVTELLKFRDAAGTSYINIRALTDPTTPSTDATSSSAVDTANGSITGGTPFKVALRFRTNDWALYKDGASVGTDTTHAVPSPLDSRIEILGNTSVPTWLRRVTWWRNGLTNAQLQGISTTGPSAVEYDSGWVPAMRAGIDMNVSDNTWGLKHDVQFIFPTPLPMDFCTIQVADGTGARFSLGRVFAPTSWLQPAVNVSWGLEHGLLDLSEQSQAINGTIWTLVRDKPKTAALSLDNLTLAEGDLHNELMQVTGIGDEVYYLPDPSDPAASQRYGFLGQLQTLNPVKYPKYANKAVAYGIRQKR